MRVVEINKFLEVTQEEFELIESDPDLKALTFRRKEGDKFYVKPAISYSVKEIKRIIDKTKKNEKGA